MPSFSDWTFQADISYTFSEKVRGVDLDYWFWYASASYFVTPRFAPRIFLVERIAPDALTFPEDFPEGIDSESFYEHDRTLKHNYLNAGVGFNYIVSEQYAIQANYFRTLEPDNIVEVDHAITLGLTYRF